MGEKLYRFDASAIDELNKDRTVQRPTARQFAWLMAGLVALMLLLYMQIAWWTSQRQVEPDRGAATKVSPAIFLWARYELVSKFRQRVAQGWSCDGIERCPLSSVKRINELGLSEYAERFAENEIDVAVLPLLIA